VRALRRNVHRFAALGHDTRLSLLLTLGERAPLSITELADGTSITRQAVAKHLRVLEHAGLVRSARHGREKRFRVDPAALGAAGDALAEISHQWDEALARLKAHVEG
jgi:DNA-binding transcriptional ArsR family regulator